MSQLIPSGGPVQPAAGVPAGQEGVLALPQGLTIGFEITFELAGKQITLDLNDINELVSGNVYFELPANEKVEFPTIPEFYNGLQPKFGLPVIDWSQLPDPVPKMLATRLELLAFRLRLANWNLAELAFEIKVYYTGWTVPVINLTLVSTGLKLEYKPGTAPVVTTGPTTPVPA